MNAGTHVMSSRSGGIAGIVSVLLMAIGIVYVATFDLPYGGSAAALASAVEEDRRALGLGVFLFALAGAALLWFLGALHGLLRRAEGGPGSLSAVALAAGSLWAFLWILYAAMVVSGFELMDYYNDPQGAKAAFGIGWNTLVGPIAPLLTAVLLAATALIALKTRAIPGWLGRTSAVLALLMVIGSGLGTVFGGPAFLLILAFALWVLATSAALLRDRGSKSA